MKIRLPKTMAEPWTISWELIALANDDKVTAFNIEASLRAYLDTLKKDGMIPVDEDGPFPRLARNTVLDSLRVIARRKGGLEVGAMHGELIERDSKQHVAWIYHILFRTRKNGPVHSIPIMP